MTTEVNVELFDCKTYVKMIKIYLLKVKGLEIHVWLSVNKFFSAKFDVKRVHVYIVKIHSYLLY